MSVLSDILTYANERKGGQAHIPPFPHLPDNATHNELQGTH